MQFHLGQERICRAENRIATITQSVVSALTFARFAHHHLMLCPRQLTYDAAQEMRVAVVPAGGDGVAKQHDLHANISPHCELMDRPAAPANNEA
jgi:hypothetical protein